MFWFDFSPNVACTAELQTGAGRSEIAVTAADYEHLINERTPKCACQSRFSDTLSQVLVSREYLSTDVLHLLLLS